MRRRTPGFALRRTCSISISNPSGAAEIYVRPFSANSGGESSAGGKWMVSRGGGLYPHWRADGKQLLYMTQPGTVMAADVKSDKTFEAGGPRRLFDSGFTVSPNSYYGVTTDAKRFMFPLPQASSSTPAPFTILMNWQAGLKK
jgi:hypothetical protein